MIEGLTGQHTIDIERVRLEPRTLRGDWMIETINDLESLHGVGVWGQVSVISQEETVDPRTEDEKYFERLGL